MPGGAGSRQVFFFFFLQRRRGQGILITYKVSKLSFFLDNRRIHLTKENVKTITFATIYSHSKL